MRALEGVARQGLSEVARKLLDLDLKGVAQPSRVFQVEGTARAEVRRED